MDPVHVVLDFEQATSKTELAEKAAKRAADGWIASAEPREFIHRNPDGTEETRFSQGYHRLVSADEAEWPGLVPPVRQVVA